MRETHLESICQFSLSLTDNHDDDLETYISLTNENCLDNERKRQVCCYLVIIMPNVYAGYSINIIVNIKMFVS